jgi:hypothetical protein
MILNGGNVKLVLAEQHAADDPFGSRKSR